MSAFLHGPFVRTYHLQEPPLQTPAVGDLFQAAWDKTQGEGGWELPELHATCSRAPVFSFIADIS